MSSHLKDFSKAVTLPNGDLYFPPERGQEREDTIQAPAPMAEPVVSDAMAEGYAASRRAPAAFEIIEQAVKDA